jgi:hypothetical protein
MIMDADPVEACVLAAGDERGDVWQWPADRDAEIDSDPGHLTKAPALSKRTRLPAPKFNPIGHAKVPNRGKRGSGGERSTESMLR